MNQNSSIAYEREFIALNLGFAEKACALMQRPIEDVLLDYTCLYRCLNIGREFHVRNRVWLAYIGNYGAYTDKVGDTYRLYIRRQKYESLNRPPKSKMFGCFWYEEWPLERIRLHFSNVDQSIHGPLSVERFASRREELREMFAHIRVSLRNARSVVGRSWLYNMQYYRRLFPMSYLKTARPFSDPSIIFRRISLWGQLLDHTGHLVEERKQYFSKRLQATNRVDQLHLCFPYQVQLLESGIEEFYDFFEIG